MSLFSIFKKEYLGLPGYKAISPSLQYKDPTLNNGLEKSSLVVLSRYAEPTQEQVLEQIRQTAVSVLGIKELARQGHQASDASDLECLMYVYLPEEITQKIARDDLETVASLRMYMPPRLEGKDYILVLAGDKPEFEEGFSPEHDDYVQAMDSRWQMDILLRDGNLPPQRDIETLLDYGCVSSLTGINLNPATDRAVMEAYCLIEPLYKYLSSTEKIRTLKDISDQYIDYKAFSTIDNLIDALQPTAIVVMPEEPRFMKKD
ncbi:MAG: hypothetical protein Q8R37_05035, partial [Nanoarchaeota archaeon]|nr:hypothetical protein [Nanoarchaeota archaeon]